MSQQQLDAAKHRISQLESLLRKDQFKPWSKSLVKESTTAQKVKVEDRIQQLQKEIQEIKTNTRFTKMVELENEVSVYFQEYSRLKEEFKHAYDLDSVILKLNDYKSNIDSLSSRAKCLSQKNKELKEQVKSTSLENSSLKKLNTELKKEIKEIGKQSITLEKQTKEIKRLQKILKDFELEKTRMAGDFARSNRELCDLVENLKEENSILSLKISQLPQERRKSSSIFSRPGSIIDA